MNVKHPLAIAMIAGLSLPLAGSAVRAQPAPPAPPSPPAPAAAPDAPAPPAPPDAPAPPPPDAPVVPDPVAEVVDESTPGSITVHVLGTRGAYVALAYDILDVDTAQMVAQGRSTDAAGRGEVQVPMDLLPGTYKIVRRGEPFETRVDYAIVQIDPGIHLEYLLVVDPDSYEFRGSGPVIGELPRGIEIGGIRLSLNGGGNLLMNQRFNAVGNTSGTTNVLGLFGNFGLSFDRGPHFVDVTSDFRLDLLDPVTGSVWPTNDRFQASGLYSYKIKGAPIGPYVRASMQTRLFTGFAYLESNSPTGAATINRIDGTTETIAFGTEANPDDLRIKVASAFAPLKLQEEVGANFKAVDLDLRLLKLSVGTRAGFGFRQGFMNGLLVVRGSEDDAPVVFDEVDDYTTLGPVIGADASVTFARWLFANGHFSALVPVTNTDDAGSSFGARLLIDLAGTAGFKVPILADFLYASADYTFRVERDGYITGQTQFEHSLMARATVTLF